MTTSDDGMPGSAAEREAVSRLRSAAAWSEALDWNLEAADVMGGAALAPSTLAGTESSPGRTKNRTAVRLRPRLVWAALAAAAIAAAIVVPSSIIQSDKGGGAKPNAAAGCTTTVHGVAVASNGDVVELPINPGPIISRAEAISFARSTVLTTTRHLVPGGVAKLSSWTEISTLIQSSEHGESGVESTPGPAAEPWSPSWAVLLSMPADKGPGAPGPTWYVVVMSARAGDIRLQTQTGVFPSWYSALSDRDPSLKGCPGGSSARLPFGELTRGEEEYTIREELRPGTQAILTLTSVPVLNRADPGLYGGCVRQNCSLDELVWPRILIYRAAPGHTLACLPQGADTSPGYRPKQVKEYFTVSVPGGSGEIGCGPLPPALANLKDLAPPAG